MVALFGAFMVLETVDVRLPTTATACAAGVLFFSMGLFARRSEGFFSAPARRRQPRAPSLCCLTQRCCCYHCGHVYCVALAPRDVLRRAWPGVRSRECIFAGRSTDSFGTTDFCGPDFGPKHWLLVKEGIHIILDRILLKDNTHLTSKCPLYGRLSRVEKRAAVVRYASALVLRMPLNRNVIVDTISMCVYEACEQEALLEAPSAEPRRTKPRVPFMQKGALVCSPVVAPAPAPTTTACTSAN